jgi:ATP phosphoribosyltransferase
MTLMIALPSKGAIAEPTLNFLKDSGLRVEKPNERQYTGIIPAIPHMTVLFQRVKDVFYKVSDGTVQLGITGYDVIRENSNDNVVVIHDALGYGHCQLIVAVPEAWVDVDGMADLADVAQDFRDRYQRNLRIATTYPSLTRQFMHTNDIHHFTLVKAEGAIEAAPTIGYADIVVDLTQTGTTLRENHLKPLGDGVIVESQACLIGNLEALRTHPQLLSNLRTMLEYIDAGLQGKRYQNITVNICGETPESIAQKVAANPITRGLQGPTIAPIYSPRREGSSINGQWYTVTLTIQSKQLLEAVEYLRSIGGTQVTATPLRYVFLEQSSTFAKLVEQLG